MSKQAPFGWTYKSVETPDHFDEILVPVDPAARTKDEQEMVQILRDAAEHLRTHVRTHAWRRG